MSTPTFSHAWSTEDILESHPLMKELRPQLESADDYLEQVRRQQSAGYRLLLARVDERICALAGYRVQENTFYGRFLYVDDLVSLTAFRGKGLGKAMLDVLEEIAKSEICIALVLDTGVSNIGAQRFYARHGMEQKALHFSKWLV